MADDECIDLWFMKVWFILVLKACFIDLIMAYGDAYEKQCGKCGYENYIGK